MSSRKFGGKKLEGSEICCECTAPLSQEPNHAVETFIAAAEWSNDAWEYMTTMIIIMMTINKGWKNIITMIMSNRIIRTRVALAQGETKRRCPQRRTIISSVAAHTSDQFPAIIRECSNDGCFLQRGNAGEYGHASDNRTVPDAASGVTQYAAKRSVAYTSLSHITASALPVTQMRVSVGGGTGTPAAMAAMRAEAACRSCMASFSGTGRLVVRSIQVTAVEGASAVEEDIAGRSASMNLAASAWSGSIPRHTSRAT